MTTRGERLKKAREKRFRSYRQAAISIGVPVSTYLAHEHAEEPGGRDYSTQEATFYGLQFGVRPEFLMFGDLKVPVVDFRNPPPVQKTVPFIGYVAPRDVVRFFAADEITEAPTIEGATAATVAIEVRNNGDFHRWLAYFDNHRRPMTPALFGQVCVIEIDDGTVYMRRVQRSRSRGWVHLIARNDNPI